MNKLMVNEIGEESELRRIKVWFQQHKITPEAQNELLIILYGKQILHKENIQ